ncbi:hypothetical protein HPT27_12110 [Permianibacter sp. IMCC34836]|uniref:hypothetical protein n=1 Tax=Permianibacter fluminis TaxID=2738515 RepID=UPI001554B518|nr:hypothetical protein [Permianibacter fluminis]NQD37772.1 hypothetical protein [Permianibacter fluminis]
MRKLVDQHGAATHAVCALVLAGTLGGNAEAAETIDFVAEHLLEVPMDTRYLALPQRPFLGQAPETRLQLGYAHLQADTLANSVPMLAIQRFQPLSDDTALLFSGFYDQYNFSGNTVRGELDPYYVESGPFPERFMVDITDVSGDGAHYGVSVAYSKRLYSYFHGQVGVTLERMKIRSFEVAFTTVDLPTNFSGNVDYAATYDVVAPFLSFDWEPREVLDGWLHSGRIILVWPQPHKGFVGRISGPDFDLAGDTDQAGNGKHIPDAFLGFSYSVEHQASGWRFDIGALLHTYLLEPTAHKDVGSPIFITVTVPFD